MKKICCIGIIVADNIVNKIQGIPVKGELQTVENICISVGGCASNCAVDLAKLGIRADLVGKVGKDYYGEILIDLLKKDGVDIQYVSRDGKTGTAVTIVLVHKDGERSFYYYPGTNGTFTKEDIDLVSIDRNDYIFIAGALLMPKFDGENTVDILKYAKERGKTIVMDTAYDSTGKWLETLETSLRYIDIFMPSYLEAKHLFKEEDVYKMAEKIHSYGVQTAIIKLGKEGAFVSEQNKEGYIVPAYKDIEVMDTNGAGDAFCAGFLAGLALEKDIKEAVYLGNAVGAHCVMGRGATQGIKSLGEVIDFMNHH